MGPDAVSEKAGNSDPMYRKGRYTIQATALDGDALPRLYSLLNREGRYILTSFIGRSDTWSEHAGWCFS
jgi:hypothetical protein